MTIFRKSIFSGIYYRTDRVVYGSSKYIIMNRI